MRVSPSAVVEGGRGDGEIPTRSTRQDPGSRRDGGRAIVQVPDQGPAAEIFLVGQSKAQSDDMSGMDSELEALDAIVAPPPGVVIDVGGHHGSFAARFAGLGYSVVAVEPLPYNLERLRRTLTPYPGVRIIEAALSNTTGQTLLYHDCPSTLPTINREWASCVFRDQFRSLDGRKVRTLSWRDFAVEAGIPSAAIELLKIDAEGSDEQILGSLFESGCPLPRILLFEGAGAGVERGALTDHGAALVGRLEAAGYEWLRHFSLDGRGRDLWNHLLVLRSGP